MNLQSLITIIKVELVKIVNAGLQGYDLLELQKIRNDYLLDVESNRVLSVLSGKVGNLLSVPRSDRVETFLELNELIQKLSKSLTDFKKAGEGEDLNLPIIEARSTRYNEIKNLQLMAIN